jgi:tryptophanyl-tRNA synthetase
VKLLDDADTIRRKFKTAVTDSGREIRRARDKPGVSNLVDILAATTQRTPEEVEAAYEGKGYGDLKTDVGEAVVAVVAPVRERYLELRADEPELLRLLAVGAAKATAASAPTLEAMYERMGFVRPG